MIGDSLQALSDVDNVFIYVADSLRYDSLPESVAEHGVSVKTVAPALATYMSMPSIVTGLSPRHHGVRSWGSKIPKQRDFLHDPDVNTAYPGDPDDVHHEMLRMDKARGPEDLDSPWFCYAHSYLSHLPYEIDELDEFVVETAGDIKRTRELYDCAVESVAARFEEHYRAVQERGELDETLFVFTGDHGEYLGESGLVGHSSPIRPEGVYVPTVFIHPDLPDTQADGIIRSVDIYPTVLSATGRSPPEWVDGTNLFASQPEYGYTDALAKLNNETALWDASSVWDESGGYVQVDSGLGKRLATVAGKIGKPSGWQARHLRRRPQDALALARHYLRGWQTFGTPHTSEQRARQLLAEYRDQTPVEPEREDLTEAQRENLQALGYL